LFASVASSSLGARLVSGFSPPWVVTQMVLSMLESTIKEVAQFSVYDLQPVAVVPTMRVPALFIHAEDDTLIGVHHVEKLVKARPKRRRFASGLPRFHRGGEHEE
jgi:predicted alpha/beta-fold hydrolase